MYCFLTRSKIKLQKVCREDDKVRTIGFRLIDDSKVKWVFSYSKALNKKGWSKDNGRRVMLGYYKSKRIVFMARALIIGNHKFSILKSIK